MCHIFTSDLFCPLFPSRDTIVVIKVNTQMWLQGDRWWNAHTSTYTVCTWMQNLRYFSISTLWSRMNLTVKCLQFVVSDPKWVPFPLRSPGLLIQPTMRSLLLFLSPGRKLPKQPECDTRWVLELRPRRQHIFVASSPALLTPFTFFCRFMSLTALLYWCFTGDEDFMTRLSFFTRFQTIISLFQLNYIKCGSKSGKNCTLYNIHCQTLMYQICRLWRVKGHYCKNNVTSRSSFQTIIEHVLLWFCTFCRFDVIIYKLSYIM